MSKRTFRDALTGMFTSAKDAAARPGGTVSEPRTHGRQIVFAELKGANHDGASLGRRCYEVLLSKAEEGLLHAGDSAEVCGTTPSGIKLRMKLEVDA